ncbi:MAG: hypothetical protein ABDH20_11165 [Thermus sp.]
MRALPQLACDRVMPLWVARAYGLPPGLGVVRWTWLGATARAERRRRVWWLAWSPAEASLPPHIVRHGLVLSVARYLLGVEPGAWDTLAVREVRQGAARRSIRGREWARRDREWLRGVSRPDSEWWRSPYPPPTAVEVDAGKVPLDLYRSRVRGWLRVYDSLLVLVLSRARGEAWLKLLPDLLVDRPYFRLEVWLLEGWWTEGARMERLEG